MDSLKGVDDFISFPNSMNEFYARDTSRKIRSAVKVKGMFGKHTSSGLPYGYLKSPEDKTSRSEWETFESVQGPHSIPVAGTVKRPLVHAVPHSTEARLTR